MGWEDVYREGLWEDIDSCPELPEILKLTSMKHEKILDIGCSFGRITKPLAQHGFYVYAIDIVDEPLQTLKAKTKGMKNVYIQKCKSTELFFESDYFDGCVAVNSIYHGRYPDVKNSMREIERVLKANGWFYGTFLSKKDSKYGRGINLGEDTFISQDGADPGVPHWFTSRDKIEELFNKWEIQELKHDVREEGPNLSAHWVIICRLKK